MKRLFAICMSIIIIMQTFIISYAEEINDIKVAIAENKVTVTAKVDSANSYYAMTVLKDGGNIKNVFDVFNVSEGMSNENKDLTFTFNMPEERNGILTDGKYNIYIKGKNTVKKEIPILLLTGLSVAACYIWWEASVWQQVWKAGIAVLLGLSGIWLVYGKRIGIGDVWMLICLAIIWPQEVFLQSLCHAAMLLCTIATVIWIMTGNEQIQIPMVPFLVLGYWL